jgi:hypothetical protein
MRRRWEIGFVVTWAAFGSACGGQSAQESAQPPPLPSASASTSAGSGAAPSNDSATTTSALGDAAPASSVKLPEAQSAPAAAESEPKSGHVHEAGRGVADIRALVVARRDDARACYDAAVAAHPGIEGDIVVTWAIDPKGAVTAVGTDTSRSQISEPSLVSCLGDVIKKVQFAPSPGGYETKASYPFNFHPHHTKHTQ